MRVSAQNTAIPPTVSRVQRPNKLLDETSLHAIRARHAAFVTQPLRFAISTPALAQKSSDRSHGLPYSVSATRKLENRSYTTTSSAGLLFSPEVHRDPKRPQPGSQDNPSVSAQDHHAATDLKEKQDAEREKKVKADPATPMLANIEYTLVDSIAKEAIEKDPNATVCYSHNFYRNGANEKVLVHYCSSYHTIDTVAKLFGQEQVIGFDMEWNPFAKGAARDSIQNNVSLIQIASQSRVALFHIAMIKGKDPAKFIPKSLQRIMESKDIIKTGVNIGNDFLRVLKFLGITAQSVVELSHIHHLVNGNVTKAGEPARKVVSLAFLVQEHLGWPLHKGNVRMSNWALRLNSSQCNYAATDAYASLQAFYELERKRVGMESVPSRPEFVVVTSPSYKKDKMASHKEDAGSADAATASNSKKATEHNKAQGGEGTVEKEISPEVGFENLEDAANQGESISEDVGNDEEQRPRP